MESQFLKKVPLLAMCFHSSRNHVFYLSESPITKGLIVYQEDLITNQIINTYIVPREPKENRGFILKYDKKKQYLLLAYPISNLCIWDTRNQQTLLLTELGGKHPYELNTLTISEQYQILFFSAMNQRNIYCIHIEDAIQMSQISHYTKLKLPKKVHIFAIQTHPIDAKIVAGCSDGQIRIWNYNSFTQLKSLTDPQGIERINDSLEKGKINLCFICLDFSNDGTKLVGGTDEGKIYCWEGRSIGNKNILLTQIKISEIGIFSLCWHSYPNDPNSLKLLCFTGEGAIISMKLQMLMNQKEMKEKKVNQMISKFSDIQTIYYTKNEIRMQGTTYPNICFGLFLQVHSSGHLLGYMIMKQKNQISNQGQPIQNITFQGQYLILHDQNQIKSEYPIFSEQYPHEFNSLIPNQEKSILFQGQIFYIDNMDIKSFSMARGQIKTITNLKHVLISDDIIFQSIQFRPLTMDYVSKGKFLVFYKLDNDLRSALLYSKIDDVENQILNFKEIPCVQSFFIGEPTLRNPPIFYLHDSRQSFQIDIDIDESNPDLDLGFLKNTKDSIRNTFDVKVQRAFWTPFRKGFALLYQNMNENVLRFSRNVNPEYDILDFNILTTSNTFRIACSEIIYDVVWYNHSENMQIGAVICLAVIFFIDKSLNIIRSLNLKSHNNNNIITQAQFFGPTLFYSDMTHINYISIDGTHNPLISYDNYEIKNLFGMIMMDRILVITKKQAKKREQIEFKAKSFSILEPILVGYISLFKHFNKKIDKTILITLIQRFFSNKISHKLIQKLDNLGYFELSKYLMNNEEYKQFTCSQKIINKCQLLEVEGYYDILFPLKNLKDANDVQEIIKRLKNDPRYLPQRVCLQHLQNYFLTIGEFKQSYIAGSLLSDNQSLLYLQNPDISNMIALQLFQSDYGRSIHNDKLYMLTNGKLYDSVDEWEKQKFIEQFHTHISQIDLEQKDINFQNQDFKQNIHKICKLLEKQKPSPHIIQNLQYLSSIKQLQQIHVQFGDNNYYQIYKEKQKDEEDFIQKKIDVLQIDNVVQYLGLLSRYSEQAQNTSKQQNVQEGNANEQFADYDFGEDEEGEFQDITIYWRFDEGKGYIIDDLGNHENSGEIQNKDGLVPQQDNFWILLKDGAPLEFKDNWGRNCPQQYCINIVDSDISVKSKKNKWFKEKNMKPFTIELWIRLLQTPKDAIIIQIGENNDFIFGVNTDQQLFLIINNENKKFNPFKDEENEELPEVQMTVPTLLIDKWTHVCLIHDNDSGCMHLGIGCRNLFQADDIQIPKENFKDKNIFLCKQNFFGQITELRFRKQKISFKEIKDEYNTPLGIVSEKRKKLQVRFIEKDNNATNDLKNFKIVGFDFNLNNEQKIEENKEEIPIPKKIFPKFEMPEEIQQPQEELKKIEKDQIKEDEQDKHIEVQQVKSDNQQNFDKGFDEFQFKSVSDPNAFHSSNFGNFDFKSNNDPNTFTSQAQGFGFENNSFNQNSGFGFDNSNFFTASSKFENNFGDFSNFQAKNNEEQNFENNEQKNQSVKDEKQINSEFQTFEQTKKDDNLEQPQIQKLPEEESLKPPPQILNEESQKSLHKPEEQSIMNNQKNPDEIINHTQNSIIPSQKIEVYINPLQNPPQQTINTQLNSKQEEEQKIQSPVNDFFTQKVIPKSDISWEQNFESAFQPDTKKEIQIHKNDDFLKYEREFQNHLNDQNLEDQRQIFQKKQQQTSTGEDQGDLVSEMSQSQYFDQAQYFDSQSWQQKEKIMDQLFDYDDSEVPPVPPQRDEMHQVHEDEQEQKMSSTQVQEVPQVTEEKVDNKKYSKQIQEEINVICKLTDSKDYKSAILAITEAQGKVKSMSKQFQDDQNKLKILTNIISFLSTYRFALQLLVGVEQVRLNKLYKKEIYIYLIVIHLPLQPHHRISFIIELIGQCIEYKNIPLADSLLKGLLPNLQKVKVSEDLQQQLQKYIQVIENIHIVSKNQPNTNLHRLVCPFCKKTFSFKGAKECNKCHQTFILCYQTLNPLKPSSALNCNTCPGKFSNTVRKDEEQCPLCRIGKLQQQLQE